MLNDPELNALLDRIEAGMTTAADAAKTRAYIANAHGDGYVAGEHDGAERARPPVVGVLLINLFCFCTGAFFAAAVAFPHWCAA